MTEERVSYENMLKFCSNLYQIDALHFAFAAAREAGNRRLCERATSWGVYVLYNVLVGSSLNLSYKDMLKL